MLPCPWGLQKLGPHLFSSFLSWPLLWDILFASSAVKLLILGPLGMTGADVNSVGCPTGGCVNRTGGRYRGALNRQGLTLGVWYRAGIGKLGLMACSCTLIVWVVFDFKALQKNTQNPSLAPKVRDIYCLAPYRRKLDSCRSTLIQTPGVGLSIHNNLIHMSEFSRWLWDSHSSSSLRHLPVYHLIYITVFGYLGQASLVVTWFSDLQESQFLLSWNFFQVIIPKWYLK